VYDIDLANPQDVPRLGEIERRAVALFQQYSPSEHA
jgi:hypothetical protein